MAAAVERDAAAAAAAATAGRQRKERLEEAEFLQQRAEVEVEVGEREQQPSDTHNEISPADENEHANIVSNDADDATERFEAWLEPVLDSQHGIVGDTATMYISFAVALLQLEEKGGSTLEQLAELKRAALDTLFGELSNEEAQIEKSNDSDGDALGAKCWEFWAREVLPHMQDPPTSGNSQERTQPNESHEGSPITVQDGARAPRASSTEPEPELEPELAPERRIDPSDGVAYEYASFEQVYGPLRAPELWIKAGELMTQADASVTETGGSGGAYVPPHKKGKKGSKKGVALSLE
eukprot:COSAG02_NODE_10001_length_2054_cov_1.741688_4_plen_295_part_01